jgi:5'-deoxynucleotidase YfbR-like HD superfamily hydrolase
MHRTLKKVRRLNEVKRCCLFPVINQSSVAEHSLHTAMIAVFVAHELLAKGVTLDLAKVTQIAVFHDVEECYISDVPFTVKQHPGVREALQGALVNQIEIDTPYAPPWFKEIVSGGCDGSIEWKIVKACDMAELIMYIHDEMALGNQTMPDMLERAQRVLRDRNEELGSELLWSLAAKYSVTEVHERMNP